MSTKISALPADAAPTRDDLVVTVNDPSGTPVNRKGTLAALLALVLETDLTFSDVTTGDVSAAKHGYAPKGTKTVLQVANTQTGAVATGTTTVPFDDTIPQNTEGTEFMTLAITPTNAANILQIDVVANMAPSTTVSVAVALFQDTTADALAAASSYESVTNARYPIMFRHTMVAGTTSPTTFKVRAGPSGAATVTFNGAAGGRIFGGVMASSITITEMTP